MISEARLKQLGHALEVQGWTDSDIDRFGANGMPSRVLVFVREASLGPDNEAALAEHGSKTLEEVFTPELTMELGFALDVRDKFLKAVKGHLIIVQEPAYAQIPAPIETIYNLAAFSLYELKNIPRVGASRADYAEQVLKTLGIIMRNR